MNKTLRTLVLVITCICAVSCERGHIPLLESVFNINLKEKISFVERIDHWVGIQGNGYYIEIYEIKVGDVDEIIKASQENRFIAFDKKSSTSEIDIFELRDYIKNANGFYKNISKDKERSLIIVDTTNNKLILYYAL